MYKYNTSGKLNVLLWEDFKYPSFFIGLVKAKQKNNFSTYFFIITLISMWPKQSDKKRGFCKDFAILET